MNPSKSRRHRIRHRDAVMRFAVVVFASAAMIVASNDVRDARGEEHPAQFLVATPDMTDPTFQQSVVLILPHGDDPIVVGVIVNKPTTIPVRQFFSNAPAFADKSEPAYFGGPVDLTDPSLLMRASAIPANAHPVFDDVYISTDLHAITTTLKNPHAPKGLRLLIGRAQWTPNQLRTEILTGAWYVLPANADQVFSASPGRLWRKMIDRAQMQETGAPRIAPWRESICSVPVGTLRFDGSALTELVGDRAP